MLIAGIYESWRNDHFEPNEAQLQALEQFAVDIGDRRVFAGVHFPSDNLASWIITLRLLPEVCDETLASNLIVSAILNKSHVFRLVKESGSDVYRPALNVIDELCKDLAGPNQNQISPEKKS